MESKMLIFSQPKEDSRERGQMTLDIIPSDYRLDGTEYLFGGWWMHSFIRLLF